MHVGILGPLQIERDGRPIEVGGGRLRALVACLALEAGRPVRADRLVEAVWDHGDQADAAHSLQSLVSRLRRTLGGAELVPAAPGGYRLALEPDAVDAARFERLADDGGAALARGGHATAADVLAEALALWRGPALADVPDSAIAQAAAAALEARRLTALADRIEADLALGAGARVIAELESLTADHPLDERFSAQLMTALYAGGRQADALAVYERVRRALDAELGVAPSPVLQAAHLSVLHGAAAAPAHSETSHRRSNLRAPLTSFVGREEELARIAALLTGSRLVTLVGPGGAGKTRLAGEAVGRRVDDVADGVWMVELAPLTDPVEIVPAVIASLGLRDTALVDRPGHRAPRDGLDRVLDVLRDREAIVVLDNCEHLVAPAAELAETLLGACPRLRILATSREPLGITGESLVPVPPLPLPRADAGADDALADPAVRLFADRAAAVQPGFAVDDDTVVSVVEICRRLDGLPLAIELAAARLRSMPVAEIARRLDDRFRLLTGGSRTALPRHRTLRAVVDWSWELLSEPERRLARRLAVFAAGATTESAAAVCAGDGIEPDDVPDGLAALVDRSLLQAEPGSAPPRYRMLETIREYGLEQLATAGEIEAVRGAHARWFADLAVAAEPRLRGPEQLEWYHRLDHERDNVLAALRWLGDTGDAAEAVRLVVAMLWFWLLSGSHDEAQSWLGFALAVPGESDPVDRLIAEAVATLGAMEDSQRGDMVDLMRTYSAAVEPLDDRDRPLLAAAKPVLALFAREEELAAHRTQAALAHPDPWVHAAMMLFAGAKAENLGDADATRDHLAAALRGFEEVGDRWGASVVLTLEAGRRIALGDLDGAEQAAERARREMGELSPASAIWVVDLRMADVALRRGELTAAREHTRRVMERSGVGADDRIFAQVQSALIELVAGDVDQARRELDPPLARLAQTAPTERPDRGHARAVVEAARASVELAAGDVDAARRRLPAAYATAVATTDMPVVATVGCAVATLALELGDAQGAAEVLGAAAVLRGGDDPTHPLIVMLRDRLRAALGDEASAAAYGRGRAMTREQALARLDPAASDPAAVGP